MGITGVVGGVGICAGKEEKVIRREHNFFL